MRVVTPLRTQKSRPPDRLLRAAFLLAVVMSAGCSSVEPFAIPKTLLLGVLVLLKERKKLQFATGEKLLPGETAKTIPEIQEDCHKAWFIFRRTELIGTRHATFDVQELARRVGDQFDSVVTYLNSKIGPGGPLNQYAEPGGANQVDVNQPFASSAIHHFDLNDVAQTRKGLTTIGLREMFREQRHRAIRTIVWHAAGMHDELWSENGDGPALTAPILNELLDRRLRSIERMRLQVNSERGSVTPPVDPRGPWLDGSRVRVFEYPDFPKQWISPADVSPPAPAPPDFDKIWVDFTPSRYKYNWPAPRGFQARFFPEPGPDFGSVSADWRPKIRQDGQADSYSREPGPGAIAPKLDALFQSAFDIWDRTWLFCDISISAMHLEALRFALERRTPGADLDTLVRGPSDMPRKPFLGGIIDGELEYDVNDRPIRTKDDGTLWSDGVDQGLGDTGPFDNLLVKYRDLQVGDHVLLWNHHLYMFVTNGFWRLENAFVTEMDVVVDHWDEEKSILNPPIDPATFMTPNKTTLRLDGLGAGHNYPEFRRILFASVEQGIANIYREIANQPGDQAFIYRLAKAKSIVFPWNPYGTGVLGTPWWIFLSRLTEGSAGSVYRSAAKMVAVITHSVWDDPSANRGAGYTRPEVRIDGQLIDISDGVLFPLHMPRVDGREMEWSTYFQRRQGGVVVAEIKRTTLTAELVPGLFVSGETQPFEVIRPRVRV